MLLDGEPGPGGLSAASPQSQAWGRGPRPPSGRMGEGGSEESPKNKTEPPSRGSKALRDEDKAWVTRTEPQDHRGALIAVPWSIHQAVTGPPPGAGLSLPLEARRTRCSGRSRRMGRQHHSIPQPGGDSPQFQVHKEGSTLPRGGWLSPTASGVLLALAPLLNCSLSLPSFLISSQPSFHASFYPFFHALFPCFPLFLSPSFLPFWHSFPLMKSHREKLHSQKARVSLVQTWS